MYRKIKSCLTNHLYRLLIVKVIFVDKAALPYYPHFKHFCELQVPTNQGLFTFVFKEDRRSKVRVKLLPRRMLSSYFVELIPPENTPMRTDILQNRIVLIVSINAGRTNYQALANILLDNYIHTVDKL